MQGNMLTDTVSHQLTVELSSFLFFLFWLNQINKWKQAFNFPLEVRIFSLNLNV